MDDKLNSWSDETTNYTKKSQRYTMLKISEIKADKQKRNGSMTNRDKNKNNWRT